MLGWLINDTSNIRMVPSYWLIAHVFQSGSVHMHLQGRFTTGFPSWATRFPQPQKGNTTTRPLTRPHLAHTSKTNSSQQQKLNLLQLWPPSMLVWPKALDDYQEDHREYCHLCSHRWSLALSWSYHQVTHAILLMPKRNPMVAPIEIYMLMKL